MLLSSENAYSSRIVPIVSLVGTMPPRRHRVRCGGVGGVVEQGNASTGKPWNTGEPSLSQGNKPEKGWHRPTTSRAAKAGDGRCCCRKLHRLPCIATSRAEPKR